MFCGYLHKIIRSTWYTVSSGSSSSSTDAERLVRSTLQCCLLQNCCANKLLCMCCWARWRMFFSLFFLCFQCFLSFHSKLFLTVPSWQYCRTIHNSLELHTRTPSAITGMRGAACRRQPAAAKPPLYICMINCLLGLLFRLGDKLCRICLIFVLKNGTAVSPKESLGAWHYSFCK